MNTKKFTSFEKARIKRTAQNVNQYVKQKNKLLKQIEALKEKLDGVQKLIDITDAPTIALTGYHSEDLVKKVYIPTKTGPMAKFELIYPDTVIPPTDNQVIEKEEENEIVII